MVSTTPTDLLPAFASWLHGERAVRSAVLFGSRARAAGTPAAADNWSDVDLHLVTDSVERVAGTDWARVITGPEFCLAVLRPATGGTRKLTVLFTGGEADLVLVRTGQMRLAALALRLGWHRRLRGAADALNTFATIMGGGYRFLKGERAWGPLYARVVAELPGFRVRDDEVRRFADAFLCDLLWVLQKLERGELVAAQRILHRALQETNVVLLHELRVRRGEATFQQARRVEQLVPPAQLAAVQVSARLDRAELAAAAWRAREGLDSLMRELVPAWSAPAPMQALLRRHAPADARG